MNAGGVIGNSGENIKGSFNDESPLVGMINQLGVVEDAAHALTDKAVDSTERMASFLARRALSATKSVAHAPANVFKYAYSKSGIREAYNEMTQEFSGQFLEAKGRNASNTRGAVKALNFMTKTLLAPVNVFSAAVGDGTNLSLNTLSKIIDGAFDAVGLDELSSGSLYRALPVRYIAAQIETVILGGQNKGAILMSKTEDGIPHVALADILTNKNKLSLRLAG